MNELRGKYVNVVLGVEEGKGMDFLRNAVYIIAHFNGRVMESDCVAPSSSPDFNTELVWETEKKIIRKIRSTNSPLRVECYAIDVYGKKECIGFTLLSLRSANIVPSSKPETQVPIKWYKLIGVPQQYKKSHPELYLSLTLRDQAVVNAAVAPVLPAFENPALEALDGHKTVVPIRFVEGGYIHIGTDDEHVEKFELKLNVKLAVNLDVLLPKNLVFGPTKEKYFMGFTMFGINISTKPFYRDLHDTIILNDHIVVKLLSSFAMLKLFFQQFYEIHVHFHHGSNKLASTKINMEKLIPNMEDNEFRNKFEGILTNEEICVFQCVPEHPDLWDAVAERQPYIKVESTLTSENGRIVKVSEMSTVEPFSIPKESPKSLSDANASGDRSKREITPIYEQEFKVESPRHLILSSRTQENGPITESIQEYRLDIILESLIWRKSTGQKTYHINFKHPRASTCLSIKAEIENTVGRNILLESLHCKLIYVSTPSRINELVKAWNPKFVIENEHTQAISQEIAFSTDSLLGNNVRESSYGLLVKSIAQAEDLAEIKVWMRLQECELKQASKFKYELAPHILDEMLAVKELYDLEAWKEKVKTHYERELKEKEKVQLAKLTEGWTERKNTLEDKLINNVNRCKTLSKELQRATNSIKIQKILQEKQKHLSGDEIRKNVIKYSVSDNYELLEKISALEKENETLKEMVCEQTQEINDIKNCSLSNEQTVNLLQEVRSLQEKFQDALKGKTYFKEQYARAVQEIHDLKTEGQKTVQNQIQSNKEALSQLSLDKFFESQHSDVFKFSEDMLNSDVFCDEDFGFRSKEFDTGYNYTKEGE